MPGRDVIQFDPSLKQWEALQLLDDDETTEIGYGGGAFGGKSFLGCFWIFRNVYAYPGTRWFLGRKELKNLRKTTLKTYFKLSHLYGYEVGEAFRYDQKDMILYYPNGSEVILLDLAYKPSDPLWTELGGLELTGGFVDESNEVQFSAIDILHTRTGRWMNTEYNLQGKILEGFNPAKNHVYSRYYKPWKEKTMPKGRAFIRALPTDNPTVTEAYLNKLRNADPITKQRLLQGNFEYDDDLNALFQIDVINDLFSNTVEPGTDRYIVVDAARHGRDLAVISVWHGLVVVDGVVIPYSDTTDLENEIQRFRTKHNVPMSHVAVDDDGVGGGIVDHLRCVGFIGNARAITPPGAAQKRNYGNLRSQCYFTLADFALDRKIKIAGPFVKHRDAIIEDLEQIKRKDGDGPLRIISKDEIKENLGRSPDFSDTFMMRMVFEIQPEQRTRAFTKKPGILGR